MPTEKQNNPDPSCSTKDAQNAGPVREAGGTTGAGNLAPDQANRTGGATGGVDSAGKSVSEPRRGVKPDA